MSSHPATLDLARDLRRHLALCQEALALSTSENQALAGAGDYQPERFDQQRKDLLPRLQESLMALRNWRQIWQQMGQAERAGCSEVHSLFQAAQGLLMKVLMLDRENQQALLRRGMLPARHLPSAAAVQPSHCVADLYRRHARG